MNQDKNGDPISWKEAHDHLLRHMREYLDLLDVPGTNTRFALTLTFMPLLARYIAGERTPELYEEMMNVQ